MKSDGVMVRKLSSSTHIPFPQSILYSEVLRGDGPIAAVLVTAIRGLVSTKHSVNDLFPKSMLHGELLSTPLVLVNAIRGRGGSGNSLFDTITQIGESHAYPALLLSTIFT